jgi:hypothetical protein
MCIVPVPMVVGGRGAYGRRPHCRRPTRPRHTGPRQPCRQPAPPPRRPPPDAAHQTGISDDMGHPPVREGRAHRVGLRGPRVVRLERHIHVRVRIRKQVHRQHALVAAAAATAAAHKQGQPRTHTKVAWEWGTPYPGTRAKRAHQRTAQSARPAIHHDRPCRRRHFSRWPRRRPRRLCQCQCLCHSCRRRRHGCRR